MSKASAVYLATSGSTDTSHDYVVTMTADGSFTISVNAGKTSSPATTAAFTTAITGKFLVVTDSGGNTVLPNAKLSDTNTSSAAAPTGTTNTISAPSTLYPKSAIHKDKEVYTFTFYNTSKDANDAYTKGHSHRNLYIILGVVGGVVLLAIIILIVVVVVMLKRKKRSVPSSAYSYGGGGGGGVSDMMSTPAVGNKWSVAESA